MEYIDRILHEVDTRSLYPRTRTVYSAATPTAIVDGNEVLLLCSNNYLGLATHPRVTSAAIRAIEQYGTSCSGSRLLSGNLVLEGQLEREIAEFKSAEAAIAFMTGYMANVGVIPAVLDTYDLPRVGSQQTVVLSDELNHASIIDGCRLANAERQVYPHKDLSALEGLLKANHSKRQLIVTDGVFSMDGDIAPLPGIVELAERHNAMVMVDDAHGTGLLGPHGAGTLDHFGLQGKVDIVMGTFSKALGGVGGFVAGSEELIRFLRITARSYIFSSALPPGSAAGIIAAIREIREAPELRTRLWTNVKRLRTGLDSLGFDLLGETHIVPILIGAEDIAVRASARLFERGVFVPCARWPAVPEGQSRLRCSVMATHTEAQIDQALDAFADVGRSHGII